MVRSSNECTWTARLNVTALHPDLRLTVRRWLTVATYPDLEGLRREYPDLEVEDIRQALEFAAANLDDKTMPLAATS